MRLDYSHVILSILLIFFLVRYCQKSNQLNDCLDRNTDPGMVIICKYDTVFLEKKDTIQVPRGDTIRIWKYDSVYVRDRDTFYVNPIFIFKDTTRNIDLEVIGGKDTFSYDLSYVHDFGYLEDSKMLRRKYEFYSSCISSVSAHRFYSSRIIPSIQFGIGASYIYLGNKTFGIMPGIYLGIGLSYDLRRKALRHK